MAVPAHDSRDHEFALKYDIPICSVVTPDDESCVESGNAYSGEGTVMNSSNTTSGLDINGLNCKEAASRVIEWAEKTGNGKKKVCSVCLDLHVCNGFLDNFLLICIVNCPFSGELQAQGLAFC